MKIFNELDIENKKLILLAGQEPVIINDIFTQISKKKNDEQFEIKKFFLEKNTNFDQIISETQNGTLFSQKSLYIFSTSNLNYAKEAKDFILNLVNNDKEDIIIFHFNKDDVKAFQNTKFYKDIKDFSLLVNAATPASYQFKNAVQNRAKIYGINFNNDAFDLFLSLVESNFSFAENELKKLNLLYGNKKISLKEINESISGNAKYDGFKLLDYCTSGKVKETREIVTTLIDESFDPIMINGLLAWFFKPIIRMKFDGIEPTKNQLETYRIYGQSQENSKSICKHLSLKQIEACLKKIIEIDQISKGIKFGNPWSELEKFIMGLCRIIYRKKAQNYGY